VAMTTVPLCWQTVGPAIEVREALKVLETMKGPNSLIEKALPRRHLLEMGVWP